MAESQSHSDQAPVPGSLVGSVFVGRQREMDELKAALEDALSGRGRLVMLVGEPGIGKTRTAQELASHAETLGFQVLWGRCYEEQGSPPYWPWVQPLRAYVQQRDPQQLRSEMGPGAADIAEIISEVREKLPDLKPPPAVEPDQARFRLFDSIATFLKNAAQNQPMMLVLEDLHWADRPSLLLLEFLAHELSGARLLVIGTYRDVEVSRHHPLSQSLGSLIREPVFRRVQLEGLTRQEVGRFVEVATGVRPTPGLVEVLHSRTEGNPLFVSEVARLLRQEGLEGEQSQNLPIPEGVRDAIGRRLNFLSEQCNQALTVASVIGREFDFRLLGRLVQGTAEDQLLGAIDEALAVHVIEEVPRSVGRYQFTHSLVQETLTQELSTARRARLHARIGETLEEMYSNSIEAHAAEIAHHFAEAESVLGYEKLVHYSLLAGERALAAYAYEEALAHFQRGLSSKEGQAPSTAAHGELVEPSGQAMDADTAALLFGVGRAQAAMLQTQAAESSLTRAFDYYVESRDVPMAMEVAQYPVDDVNSGVPQLAFRALALVPPDSHEAGRLLSHYGFHLGLKRGDYEAAEEALGRALDIARREGDAALEMWTVTRAAHVDVNHLRVGGCMEKMGRALELNRHYDDPIVMLFNNLVRHYNMRAYPTREVLHVKGPSDRDPDGGDGDPSR